MKYHLLASGSKGNAFVLEIESTSLLIDCGTTKQYLNESLDSLNMDIYDFEGVLITHNHIDHIRQIEMFKKHPFVYAPISLPIDTHPVIPYEPFKIKDVVVLPIATSHDTPNSVGYIIQSKEKKLVYITDTGYIKQKDYKYMRDADIIILESNHDPALLMKTKRPYYVKQRIVSETGHLSNDNAGTILKEIVSENTQEIVLAHLSEDANTENLALETVKSYLNGFKGTIRIGKQHEIVSGILR